MEEMTTFREKVHGESSRKPTNWEAKNRPPLGVDKSKYCRYHRVIGHKIKDCTTLKDKMEKLIQKGHLKKFIKDPSRDKDCEKERDRSLECSTTREAIETQCQDENPLPKTQLRGVVNTIAGGLTEGGSSNSTSKHYVCNLKSINSFATEKKVTRSLPSTIFTDEDFEGINQCHKDPMVGKIEVATFLVNTSTSYNILIGRLSLNELGVIISTPHLTMKFSSKNGKIITVRANQMTTRECYVASLKISKGKKEEKPKVQMVAYTSLNRNLGEAKINPREAEPKYNPLKK
ncbi:hypothetical protein JHK82_039339 [Glycine max]|nr:hypothetical protein JHK86_039521 [Glycine max]KAG4965124.1 hypothetical protein JHK85_040099 [Glycine max]KAG5110116.1 hypothetical protein JHK82_039339 [Glycine max]KAG5121403.1 hypothetical protein JHK84_039743 [Glycine max]